MDSYPNPAPAWLTPEKFAAGAFHAFDPQKAKAQYDTFRHIADWLKAAGINNEAWLQNLDEHGCPKRLRRMGTFEAAKHMADKDMLRAANILRSQFAAAAFDEEQDAGDIRTEHIFEDGSRMVRLLTPQALRRESAALGHCVGDGAYDDKLQTRDYALYSLRDPLNEAHATLEVKNNTLLQCKGKENQPPVERYLTPIADYKLCAMGPVVVILFSVLRVCLESHTT